MSQPRCSSVLAVLSVMCLLAAAIPVLADSDCCVGRVGDINGQGGDEPTIGDVARLIECKFISDPCLSSFCVGEADVNQSGGSDPVWDDVTIGDISILIDYLFISGPSLELPYCPGHSSGSFGYLYAMSDCTTAQALASSGGTCIEYWYDGEGILSLTHVAAGLNCCPIPTLTVSVLGDTIFVSEVDSGLCDCECLYTIEYRVANLPAKNYRIAVQEAVSGGGEPLDFWADLTQYRSGTFCQDRLEYPWDNQPLAYVTGRSGCLSSGLGAAASSSGSEQSCVVLDYDGAGTLTFTHGNAGFNCCPTNIGATFSFSGSTITVSEVEDLSGGGCHCLCLYDLEVRISNLPPGQYHFVFVEPYRDPSDQALDFTVDLSHATNTMFCVRRDHYPWGTDMGVKSGVEEK